MGIRLSILLGFLLGASFATPLYASSCSKALAQLSSEVSGHPLTKLRQTISQQVAEAPQGLLRRGKKITQQLSECFRSPKLSVKQQRAAQMNLAMNLLVPTTAIVGSHYYSVRHAEENGLKAPDFPFDLMGTVIVLYAWQSLIQCQNEMMPAKNPSAGFLKRSWDKYLPYLKMDIAGAGIYVGAIMLEDIIRGHDVSASDLAGEGAFGLGWDLGMSTAHVLILDRVLMRYLPGGRVWLSDMIKKGVFRKGTAQRGTKKFLFLKSEKWAEVPGLALEFLIRQGYISARSFGFVQLRNHLFAGEEEESELSEDADDL
jgi:hypothetical protein